jgi:RHS repeat-associated protein
VRKSVGGTPTLYVYDAFGRLAAEYGTVNATLGTRFLVPDYLGSTRLTLNERGEAATATRHDYLPFGEELPATAAFLRGDYNGADQSVRHRFTAKERDLETGLDYYGARYNSGAQGRFTRSDPAMDLATSVSQPQQWNRYAYVSNSPLRKIDPDGAEEKDLGIGWLQGIGMAALAAGASLHDMAFKPMSSVSTAYALIDFVTQDGPLLARGATHPAEVVDQYVKMSTSNNDADQRVLGQAFGRGTFVAAATFAPAARGTGLAGRAAEIHGVLDPIAQTQRTTAVLQTSAGRIIAGGARDLSPAQRALLGSGEIAARLPGAHAEVTALSAARALGATPEAMAVTRAICPQCAAAIEGSGGTITSPTRAIWFTPR